MKHWVATYATAGEGHKRASEAVADAAHRRGVAKVDLKDCLEGSASWFRWAYTQGYLFLVNSAPALWGAAYELTDIQGRNRWLQQIRRWNNIQHEQAFAGCLTERQPDVLIATHFFPVEVASALKRSGRLKSRLISVITDWLPHSFWICPGVDYYAVAGDATRQALIKRGIAETKIRVTGIPIDSKFSPGYDRLMLEKKLGLESGRFTILIGSGGFGLGPVEKLVNSLSRLQGPYQLLVVAGHNISLQNSISALARKFSFPVRVSGFVRNMHELMGISDLLISKPGGLTCSEAIASHLPMVITAPIPGQEARNAKVFLQEGAAIHLKRIEDAPGLVESLRVDSRINLLKAAAQRLAPSQPADRVVDLALELSQ